MHRQIPLTAGALALTAAAALAAQAGTFHIHAAGVPPTVVAEIQADLVWSERRVQEHLGAFPDTVGVRVFASRADFTAALREAWGLRDTACWMVGGADDHRLFLLSPGAWSAEACEHDVSDTKHVRRLVAHEVVHAYHGQINPSGDLGLLDDLGWFTEGLATYVSGQLDAQHAGRAADAIARGEAPEHLADAWSGPYRYGVAGSMVAFIDATWGRHHLRALLHATSTVDLLDALGVTEAGFLDRWEGWVRGQGSG